MRGSRLAQGVVMVLALMGALVEGPTAQGPAPGVPQTAPTAPAGPGRGRGPQGPPLLPTPPLTARPTPNADANHRRAGRHMGELARHRHRGPRDGKSDV